MPIYEYRCSSCGVRKEHLQKVSDPKFSVCPDCGKETYEKQLTAAGFQLKGSGWYATDFKGSPPAKKDDGGGTKKDGSVESSSKEAGSTEGAGKDSGSKEAGSKDRGADKPAATASTTPAPSAPASSTPISGS